MIKKISLLLLSLLPNFVFAAAFEGNYPNRYYGYFETLQLNNDNVMLSYFNNGYIDDDQYSPLQQLGSNSSNNYRIALSTYGIYASGINDPWYNELNKSDLRYFEQDICVSSNKISFEVVNGTSQDFASQSNALALLTSDTCDLYGENVPSGVVGPSYWSWLEHYQGYIVKVFLPIANWKVLSANDHSWQVVSRLLVKNHSDYTLYYRFLTSGGLYDHSRYFEIDDSFSLDTQNFDLSYDAIMDGIEIFDQNAHLYYSKSKNLFNPILSTQTINGLTITNNGDGSFTLNGTTTGDVSMRISDYITGIGNKRLTFSRNSSGTLSGGNYTILFYGRNTGGNAVSIFSSSSDTVTFKPNNYDNYYFWLFIGSGRTFSNYVLKPQLEIGSSATVFCPYGPTYNNNCVSHYIDGLITFNDEDLFANIGTILNLPLSLSQYVLQGVSGQCTPLSLTVFSIPISVPCGDFFWRRADVETFRSIWSLLFGGFIIYKILIWDMKVLASVLDPMKDSVGLGLDFISTDNGKVGDN